MISLRAHLKQTAQKIINSTAAAVLLVTGLGGALPLTLSKTAFADPGLTACTTTANTTVTSLSDWDTKDVRSSGHYEFTSNGLHIYTDDKTGNAKVAAYKATDFPLSGLGDQTIAQSMEYTSDFGVGPGLQLETDFNNDGIVDGILVGETVYGNTWWLSTSASGQIKNNAPHKQGGGYGSQWYGTPTEWATSFPDARVKAVGFSLGSGVYASGTLKSITLGCTKYTFALPAPTILATPTIVAPVCGSSTNNPAFTDEWTKVAGATGYEYYTTYNNGVSTYSDSTLTNSSTYDLSGTTVLRHNNSGTPQSTYSWKVRALGDGTTTLNSDWSSVCTVTTDYVAPQVTNFQQVYNTTKPRIDVTLSFSESINPTSLGQGWYEINGSNGTQFTKAYYNSKLQTVSFADQAGNTNSYSFTTDFTAPTGTLTYSPATLTNKNVLATLTTSEPVTTPTGWLLKNGANGVGTVFQKNYPARTDGRATAPYNQTITLHDLVGNPGSAQVYIDWIDTAAPTASFTYSNNNGNAVTANDVTVTLTSSEPIQTPTNWIKQDDTHFTKTFTGNIKSSVAITDLAGNTSSLLKFEVKRIDRTAPVITGIIDNGTYTDSTSYVITDQNLDLNKVTLDGVKVAITGIGGWDYSGPTVTSVGTHTLTAIDKAGNETTIAFTIVVAPALTGGQGGDSEASNSGNAPQPAAAFVPAAAVSRNFGQVLGANTSATGNTGTVNTTDDNANTDSNNKSVKGAETKLGTKNDTVSDAASKNFLGLGWWWLLVILAALALVYGIFRARSQENA